MSSRLILHTRVVRGSGGGPDKTILNSPRFLADAGYPMLCAYMRHPGDGEFAKLEQRAAKWGAPLHAVDDLGALDRAVHSRLLELCERHRPAIWHAHDYKSNFLGLTVRRRYPMPLVTTVHGWGVMSDWRTALYYQLDRFLLRRYDQVVCVSEDLHRRCLELGVTADNCWHVPNAIDTEEYRRRGSREEAKRAQGAAPGRVVVGAVGRLSREKGFDRLIRAVAALDAAELPVDLWIVGEGGERQTLERLIGELGLGERVRLFGFQEETVPLYQGMDVFALSSSREGLPNALLEAMALELPVLATRVAGVPGLVRDGVNGILVEPDSVAALVAGLERLALDAELRRRLGEAARSTIEASFSFRERMERIRMIYDRTLDDAALV